MSGLYTMVFGVNKLAGPLLAGLQIDHKEVPRFRDCFLSAEDTIVVYTRSGGGNREAYKEENEAMRRRAGYLRDEDDSYDSTYALFHFAIPEDLKATCAELVEQGWAVNSAERWAKAIEEMRAL